MSRGRRGHGGGGGSHGGSWKVAYADFVTSMMALFLVLWLVGSDEETKLAVQRYFRGEITQQGKPGTQNFAKQQPFDNPEKDRASRNLVQQVDMKRELERLREQLNTSSENGNDLIRYEFLADGVRITVIDSSAKPFFDPGTAHLTGYGTWVLKTTAWYLDRFPFQLEVEGHTQKGAELVGSNPAAPLYKPTFINLTLNCTPHATGRLFRLSLWKSGRCSSWAKRTTEFYSDGKGFCSFYAPFSSAAAGEFQQRKRVVSPQPQTSSRSQ